MDNVPPSGNKSTSSGARRMNRIAGGTIATIVTRLNANHPDLQSIAEIVSPAIGAIITPPADIPIVPIAIARPRF